MQTNDHVTGPVPNLWVPHPNFSDEVNRRIVQSEIEGGVNLDNLGEGVVLEIETQHHAYTIVNRGGGWALICGHPKYCPSPIPVKIDGSTWGGSMLRVRYIGRGMRLSFRHPIYNSVLTSRILEVRPAGHAANIQATRVEH